MLPYSISILIAWIIMLLVWILLGLPLGIDGGLEYVLPEAAK
jgi:aminobenzoyl-glutamate transport protein